MLHAPKLPRPARRVQSLALEALEIRYFLAADNGFATLQSTFEAANDDLKLRSLAAQTFERESSTIGAVNPPAPLAAASTSSITQLDPEATSQTTTKDNQSKVWLHAGRWWSVFPNSTGTWVWRLDGTTWTKVLRLSTSTSIRADVVDTGRVAQVLLTKGSILKLASIEYVTGAPGTYILWTSRPALATVSTAASNSATIDIDSKRRLWVAQNVADTVQVRYSDTPYSTWSSPITLVKDLGTIEISDIKALPNGTIGVMWSNHVTQRWGFRVHVDGTSPSKWSADEVPASQSAQNIGAGMADDHLSVAAGSDGTFYATIKTAYDRVSHTTPEVALLVRRADGKWDPMYSIDGHGTRPIMMLNELEQRLMIVYAGESGYDDIVFKNVPLSLLNPLKPYEPYSLPRQILISGGNVANPSSTKQNFTTNLVVIANSNTNTVEGAKIVGNPATLMLASTPLSATPPSPDPARNIAVPFVSAADTVTAAADDPGVGDVPIDRVPFEERQLIDDFLAVWPKDLAGEGFLGTEEFESGVALIRPV